MCSADPGVVDDAEDVVVHPLPHLGGDDGGDRPRDEHDGAHHAAALEVGVHDERDDQAEDELEADGDEGELHGRHDRVAEDRVVDQDPVVLEPDPLGRLDREELLVGEALEDRQPERVQRDQRDDHERGREHDPGEAGLLALEPPGPAAPRLAPACSRDVVVDPGLAIRGWQSVPREDGDRPSSRGLFSESNYFSRAFSWAAIPGSTCEAGVPFSIWLTPW